MKKIIFILVSVFLLSATTKAAVMVLEGKYQSKNLYIQNGYASSGVGFCTYQVTVNGQVTTAEVNSSAFEIDFSQLQLVPGTPVVIKIMHKDGCSPKVLNPDAINPKSTYTVSTITIDNSGLLKWTTTNESGSLPYIVEEFRWNKWVYAGEVQGIGTAGSHDYAFQCVPHSGQNRFRIKQIGFTGEPRYSDAVTMNSDIAKVTYSCVKDKVIEFSAATAFEVYDYYGTVVKKGFGKDLPIDNLNKGKYFLC
ncbi:MAG TPA: hypothetical protein VNG53_05110, partial [Bacteroidia bacterium]|nr:hypothetical protein [Bacteroidia bacterium]